jgi:DNA replication protein DnaC
MGWLYAADANGAVIWEPGPGGTQPKIVRCRCQSGQDSERRRRYLLRVDGLTPAEREYRFANLRREENGRAIRIVEEAVDWRRGMVTLTGKPGMGKTTLLMCAVNAAREANVPAVYTTVTDLLDYLRAAYNPASGELAFDARWDLLVRCEVLALDELDEFNTTPWAMERFLRLIDERWRALDSRLTLCATNARVNALPEKVASRLRDGRAQIVEMAGSDQRPYQAW